MMTASMTTTQVGTHGWQHTYTGDDKDSIVKKDTGPNQVEENMNMTTTITMTIRTITTTITTTTKMTTDSNSITR